MTLQEIRVSGLLELYVMGALSDEEKTLVEDTIYEYPQLKNDLHELGKVLEGYARLYKVDPPEALKSKILKEAAESSPLQTARPRRERSAKSTTKKNANKAGNTISSIPIWPIAATVLLLSTIGLWWKSYSQDQSSQDKIAQVETQLKACEDEKSSVETQLIVLNALSEPDNHIVAVEPTDKYPATALYIHNNDSSKKNYLQISNLPSLRADQTFQLWSLKGTDAPIPLDVFKGSEDRIIEVRYEANTNAYAITIEPAGGSQSPNLDELIGVFTLDS